MGVFFSVFNAQKPCNQNRNPCDLKYDKGWRRLITWAGQGKDGPPVGLEGHYADVGLGGGTDGRLGNEDTKISPTASECE